MVSKTIEDCGMQVNKLINNLCVLMDFDRNKGPSDKIKALNKIEWEIQLELIRAHQLGGEDMMDFLKEINGEK